ncbi:MAG: hypothetical protein QW572_02565 [Candidatus Nitrosocaldus sp.]
MEVLYIWTDQVKGGVASYHESYPMACCVILSELRYSYTKQLREVAILRECKDSRIVKIKGVMISDVSICNECLCYLITIFVS